MFEAEDLDGIPSPSQLPLERGLGAIGDSVQDSVHQAVQNVIDPYADIVICEIDGIRVVKPGLRRQRYRQGV